MENKLEKIRNIFVRITLLKDDLSDARLTKMIICDFSFFLSEHQNRYRIF